ILAAAGLLALEESPKTLARDHGNARYLAEGLSKIPGIRVDPRKVVTNIVIFDVAGTGRTAAEISGELGKRKVLAGATDKFSVRMVTHCDVDRAGIERAIATLSEICKTAQRTHA
ncbi:MAG: beta-eliminating lyase-related protein, partial [Candidatus Acidiferrales bacterium]